MKKIWTQKDIGMDIIKLLQYSDPLISAAKLNEILPGKIQTIFIMVAQSLDQRKNAENKVKCQAMFLAHLLGSSIGKLIYYTFK